MSASSPGSVADVASRFRTPGASASPTRPARQWLQTRQDGIAGNSHRDRFVNRPAAPVAAVEPADPVSGAQSVPTSNQGSDLGRRSVSSGDSRRDRFTTRPARLSGRLPATPPPLPAVANAQSAASLGVPLSVNVAPTVAPGADGTVTLPVVESGSGLASVPEYLPALTPGTLLAAPPSDTTIFRSAPPHLADDWRLLGEPWQPIESPVASLQPAITRSSLSFCPSTLSAEAIGGREMGLMEGDSRSDPCGNRPLSVPAERQLPSQTWAVSSNPIPLLAALSSRSDASIVAQAPPPSNQPLNPDSAPNLPAPIPFPETLEQDPDSGRQILLIPPPDDGPDPATPPPDGEAPVDAPVASPSPPASPSPSPSPAATDSATPTSLTDLVEIRGDRQDFDTLREVFSAEGNVEMRFRRAVLTADRVQVNLQNRIAVAEGNVQLVRGAQILQGDRLVYNFVQSEGTVDGARGEIFLPSSGTDLTLLSPLEEAAAGAERPRPTPRPPGAPPVSSPGGILVEVGANLDQGLALTGQREGELTRFRFEAESIEFFPDGWVAQNVRLTNDPFSPPELELRTPELTYTQFNPLQAEVRARNPRLVFDQRFSLPFLQNRVVIDNRRRQPPLLRLGYDEEVGGLFVQAPLTVINQPRVQFVLAPAILLQRAVTDNNFNFFDPSSIGLLAQLDATLGPSTSLVGTATFGTLDLGDLENKVRGSLRLRQQVGIHQLTLEYSYRDRLFNGTLGFQNVQSSLGAVFSSPNIPLGSSRINLNYQFSAQLINANTDREDLLDPPLERRNSRVTLGRFQASAGLTRAFLLWSAPPLPPTAEGGLRYSPTPIVPNLVAVVGLRGTTAYYTSEDSQSSLTAFASLQGQFGRFSRNFLDYTRFNVTYSNAIVEGESPFRFDRIADPQVLSFGLLQQIYGPIRAGFQTSINLDKREGFDTTFFLEYSRRTYSIILRVNPDREVGSLGIRINDFNWTNPPEPFSGQPQ
ncbi:DUF3769 domain-containing protein [Thermoleptolyngbya sichuanensis A183]|uniref:DUF3769 domain-containing protein n=1 Tax=Thermoleptolyngbya sichuanensis A183 TaxID=2737172 RepID=A0A6M8BNG8_9CYAN|nr:DUF3769 domain-containing protein [Thermoleptolyngbya sichuanensis]QKD83855.1 DUF3769 domain-containing protein [Thermoleptolyngbya sichuanensis A183]